MELSKPMIMISSNFKIETNYPIPKHRTCWREFPFKEMNVGDSFFVKKSTYKKTSLINLKNFLYTRIRRFLIDECSLFKFSLAFDRENDGVRVFRVE